MSAMQATVGDRKRMRVRYDWRLISAAAALLGLGVVMVASASLHKLAGAPLYYLTRHLIAIGIGVAGMWLMTRIPIREWERWGTLLFFLGMLLLVLVLVPGVGREANGATRWIPVGASNLQSSEFMKLFVVFYLAGYLVRRQIEVARQAWGFIKPMILLVMACVLIMLEPDFGTTAVLLATALGLLFLGGVPVWQFALLIGLSGVALTTLVLISPYRLQRISSFLDPWADALDSGYQLSQALIAFGRGEWFGVGLGNGIQKQFYLPEAHTDFLMAVIGEELGLLGTLVVIALFGFIVWRAFAIGARAERLGQRFASYVAQGFGLWIGLQAFINIGVNIGLLPTKGLTLPLLSYGGNSIIVACVAIGLLLRIDYELNLGVGPDSNPKEAQWVGA
ncbi:MAG: putative lipid II flippase FtsW [gamma proteobacterium symbiont of Phacoides pectinatus]